MKNNRWLPILIMLCLTGLGVFVGVNTIINTTRGKPDAASCSVINPVSKAAVKAYEAEERVNSKKVAVLRGIDREGGRIGVYLTDERKETSFAYDLATSVKSLNDRELVMPELKLGSIINLEFRDGSSVLSKVELNKEAWDYKGVRNLSIDEVLSKMQIGKSNYAYDAGLTIISGKDNVSLQNIDTAKDILEVCGLGEKVLSINITTGHGILDFTDYDDFLGGTIEVGYDIFDDVKDNMKYVLREGKYKVIMRKGKLSVNKVVDIKRDRTEVLKLSDFTREMTASSTVTFRLSPSNAAIYIDGREIEAEKKLDLDYGEYLVRVMAEGYMSWEKVVTISKPKTVMSIALALKKEKQEKEETDDGPAEPSTTVEPTYEENTEDPEDTGIADIPSENETDEEDEEIKVRTDSTKIISFRKPEGAEVLFDGRVIGDIPCEMTKVTGEHEITLKRDGYETQTFTVDIADDGEDVMFSFPEMTREN